LKDSKILSIGYQGEKGAYSADAIDAMFKDEEVKKVPYRTSYDVVDALKKNKINYGLLPLENSIIGNITHNYDLLLENKLTIEREVVIPIHHTLIAHKETKIDLIKVIYSHPAAISQCEVFLRKLVEVEIFPTYDTAGSAKMIAAKELKETAAIASKEAAELYELQILKENIEDYPNNQTRFVLLSHEPMQMEFEQFIPYKTTAVFDTLDQPGMLYECLGIFEKYKINLSQLSSRPHKTEPWKYHFFIDFDGHATDDNVINAFEEIRGKTGFLHIFGSYAKSEKTDFIQKENNQKTNIKKKKKSGPLYSLDNQSAATIVSVKDKKIGGGNFCMIAGPCSVEGRHQMMESAKIVAENGADMLRGGAFKPRSSPYSFQGLGEEGLNLLREAGDAYGLPIVTEALSVDDLPLIIQYTDIIQIGARNMQNFVLLQEVGNTMKPVLLKRGMMATVKELLLSAEYILAQGNPNVILCERGIRTFETSTRNTLDISAIPVLKEMTHLPVIIDPSHAVGVSRLIEPVSKASVAVGADGLMVEVHFNPVTALSDADQALDERQFKHLTKSIQKLLKM
jgi:chorismate mutase/prephenate dehydratase